jgi:hypothetical protein
VWQCNICPTNNFIESYLLVKHRLSNYVVTVTWHWWWKVLSQNKVHRRPTSLFFLSFSYDFGVTRNSSSNADAMVAASARLRGIHPPDIIQNGGRSGGECLSYAHWLGPWAMASAFWWWIMAWQRLLESTFCVPYSVVLFWKASFDKFESTIYHQGGCQGIESVIWGTQEIPFQNPQEIYYGRDATTSKI